MPGPAEKRIQDLDAGTTPVAPTDLIPIWQGSGPAKRVPASALGGSVAAVTNHAVVVGTGAVGSFTAVGPATSGLALVAAGALADPAFGILPLTGGGTGQATGAPGSLIGIRRITATGAYTYTPSAGTGFIIAELQGAGGGGSGVAQPGVGNVNLGGGGQGGGWLRVLLTANFSGATGSVGAKGTGGTAGNNAGTSGGSTTFVTTAGSPVTYTAAGGNNPANLGSFAPPFQYLVPTGNLTSGGDDNLDGNTASIAFTLTTNNGIACAGGSSVYSRGSFPVALSGTNQSTAGNAALGKGGGGGGAIATGTGTAKAGGDGSDGMVLIWEYR